ncbi:MAG: tRNA pseudouridine(13) synthase TruD [Bradymonadia bacterium]|jgi:tRNA pseudouridine13 synthase
MQIALLEKSLKPWCDDVIARGWSTKLPFEGEESECIGGDMGGGLEDFRVYEIPAYSACGEGEHVYLHVQKRGKTSFDVLRAIELAFSVKESEIGYAGMKDKHAITRQWFSVPYAGDPRAAIEKLSEDADIEVLEHSRHSNKIRVGHLSANRFELRLYGVWGSDRAITARCDALSRRGFINYFGKQRFGRDGANVASGLDALRGKRRLKHKELKFVISALQSAVFNLSAGMRLELFGDELFEGDVLQKRGGGCFICTEPSVDQERARAGEVVLTGALPGKKLMTAAGVGQRIESFSAQKLGLNWPEDAGDGLSLSSMGKMAMGCRRPIWEQAQDLSWTRLDESSITVSFTLSSGSYATVLMRQLCGQSFGR